MTDIALYNLLRRIPKATDDKVERAVNDVASSKEVATKSDVARVDKTITELKGELKADIERMGRIMIMWIVGIGLTVIGVIKYL